MKSKILTLLLLAIGLNVLSQSVPNTTTFSLQDVVSATGGSSLSAAFSNAVSGYFDPAYNNDTYAPSGSMLRFRNYNMSAVYVGFDSGGMPLRVSSSGGIQYGSSGSGFLTVRCCAYDPYSKIGFIAASDGRVNAYDFSQSSIPVLGSYNVNLSAALTFIKIIAGSAIFVGDTDGNVYMSPSLYSPSFHQITNPYTVVNDITEVTSGIYAATSDGKVLKYRGDDEQEPGWQDYFELVNNSLLQYSSIAANDTYLFAFHYSLNYQRRTANSGGVSWAGTSIFSNSSGVINAVGDGVNIYIVHPNATSYTHYIPSGSQNVSTLLFTGHGSSAFNVSGSSSSVAFLYADSFEITSNSGSSWTRVNYSNTYPIYYISTY